MISIEQIVEESKRKEEIRAVVKEMRIGLSPCHDHILDNVIIKMLEYAEWMFEQGKISMQSK